MTVQQSRELVFHDEGASWVVDLPAEPRIPEARDIRSLGRILGVFPKAPGQVGTWLLCDCQEEALQAFRVTQGCEIVCSQCDSSAQLLFCDCGVLSRRTASDEGAEPACLLCGAPASKLDHRCKQVPERVRITLTEGTANCCFCGWPGELWSEAHQKSGSRIARSAGEKTSAERKSHRSKSRKSSISSPFPTESSEAGLGGAEDADTFADGWLKVGLGDWIRSSKHARYGLALLGAVVPVVGTWLLLTGYRGSGGHPPRPPEGRPVIKIEWPRATTEAPGLDLSEVEPPEPSISADEADSREAARARQSTRRIRQALDSCDFLQLEVEMELEPSVLSRMEAHAEHALTLREAQDVASRVEALKPLRSNRLEAVVDNWAALRNRCPDPGLLAPWEGGIRSFVDAWVLELEKGRAWRKIEEISHWLARHGPSRPLAESYRERVRVGRHRELLAQARRAKPHVGIDILKKNRPPADLTTEHENALEDLRSQLSKQDAKPPRITLSTKSSCQAKLQIELTLKIDDDYHVEDVKVRCEGGLDPESCEDIHPIRLSDPSRSLWGVTIDPAIHGGKKLEFRVVATDLSGNEGVLNAVVRFFPYCRIRVQD